MRAFVLVGLAACTRAPAPLAEAEDRVIEVRWIEPTPLRGDVLFVIDSSPAMAPYRAQIASDPLYIPGLGGDGGIDLHLGVITSDLGNNVSTPDQPLPGQCAGWGDAAALRRSPRVDGAYIAYRDDDRGTRTNVRGSATDALSGVLDVGAGGCTRAQPLEAMRIALDHDPHDAGFLRDDAHLAVIIIAAADDASPGTAEQYRQFLASLKQLIVPVFIVGGDGPRLRAFSDNVELFAPHALGDSLFEAVESFEPFGPMISTRCFDQAPLDVDPDEPGIQPDCVVADSHQVFPRCGTTVQFPCWRISTDSSCGPSDLRIDVLRGDFDAPDNNLVVAQCVAS